MDLETYRRLALSSLDAARGGYRKGVCLYQVGNELHGAILWTMGYWLIKHGRQPDPAKAHGWVECHFRTLVEPGDRAYPLLELVELAILHSIDDPEEIMADRLPTHKTLGELLAHAGAVIERVLGD